MISEIDRPRVMKLAALAEAFGRPEYSFELLDWLATRADVLKTSLATRLRDMITQGSAEYGQLATSSPTPISQGDKAGSGCNAINQQRIN